MKFLFSRAGNGVLAALALAFACVSAPGQVLISEIMYHPPPAVSEAPAKEWVELHNAGTNAVDLSGWRFSKGIGFTFTNITIPAGGYWVVAANRGVFQTNYPGVTNVVGDWSGQLNNNGETLELVDALGQSMDKVTYYAEGDWALRRIGDVYPGQPTWWRGWQWTSPADGAGYSLELINSGMPNAYGQNWSASVVLGGTPGSANSVATNHVASFILEAQHYPVIPTSTNTVSVTARIVQEAGANASVSVNYRVDGAGSFTSAPMYDDGAHGDGAAGDAIYGAVLPAQADKTIVEFYVQVRDAAGRSRTWPAPTDDAGTQGANALYQVDQLGYSGTQPVYRFIIKASEWSAWLNLMDNVSNGRYSDPQMNATVVREDGSGVAARYRTGIRNRGAGTRAAHPHNLHLDIPSDDPLGGITRLDFNTRTVHSQVGGNALLSAAGLINAYGTPAQVRVNSSNLANATPTGDVDSYQFGSYYCFETYDSDWAAAHVPQDSGGNIYKGVWYLDNIQLVRGATLDYLGTNVTPYQLAYSPSGPTASSGPYGKQSNKSEDDWSDLINLCYVLSANTPDSSYLQSVSQVANIDEWLRYFAVNSLLINMETTLGTGVGDDFSMWRGIADPRFQLLNHDLDTTLGQGDSPPDYTLSIFKAGDISTVNRFLKFPDIAPRYYASLKTLAETTFAPASLGAVLDQALGGWVPPNYIQSMKDAAAIRRTNVLSQIPLTLTAQSALTVTSGYPRTTSAVTSLSGKANAIDTRTVLVDGVAAAYVPWQASWSATNVALSPGINRVLVQSLNSNRVVFAETNLDIWYDDGSVQTVGGTISSDTTWTAAGGPYSMTSSLTVASGATLTLQPGTTLYLGSGVTVTVANGGRLLAEGTLAAPIRFTVAPGSGVSWGGLTINGAVGSPETRIAYTRFESNSTTCIEVAAGTVFLDHLSFGTTTHQYLALDGASFQVQNCVFPTGTAYFELLHGTGGIKSGGRGIFLRNFFGVAQSIIGNYNDVFDFTGGNRDLNQPIIQFYDNVFIGGTDDLLDLDGTDAWIEGNIFLHAHKNGSPDTSSAISGGNDSGNTSEITIIGNFIYDCDHAALAKQGNFYTFLNNTIVHQTHIGGQDTAGAVLCLADDSTIAEGAGSYLEGNIIYDAEALVQNRISAVVTFTNNLMPFAWGGPGGGNSTNNPLLRYIPQLSETTNFTSWSQAQVVRDWFSLRPGSPAQGVGPNGRDLGAAVSLGASVAGEPPSPTASTSATLTVGSVRSGNGIPTSGFPNGSGYTHYRWRLDTGAWSGEIPTTTPIALLNLANGPHHVEVSGRRDSGSYQDDTNLAPDNLVTTSRTWTVNTSLQGLRLNEILARNRFILVTNGESPDLVELFNAGGAMVDLSGKGLTDDPGTPFRFTFAAGTTLGPGQYLVLFSDAPSYPARSLGFGLGDNGGGLYLFDAAANGGGLLDSVSFGPQLTDLSIGRLWNDAWGLCQPTFGSANVAQPAGSGDTLKINEWLASGAPTAPDDFVELYNPEPVPVALGGLYLTDAPDGDPGRHHVAPLSFIAANGFFAFKADGNTNAGPEHLNFTLAAEMGGIGLFASDLSLIDRVMYGPQTTGISQGRTPNGASTLGFFSTPTPGAGNPGAISVYVTNITYNLMPYTQTWRFNQSNNLDGVSWMATNYNDSAWQSGPGWLAFENNTALTPFIKTVLLDPRIPPPGLVAGHAYYFRTPVVVTNDLTGFTLNATMRLDDCGVIYINGTEFSRPRMAAGIITNGSFGGGAIGSGTEATVDETFTIPITLLHPGTNMVAVEVHQISATSSDILWGMMLDASRTMAITNNTTTVLNEVFAHNATLTNSDGTLTDWVELFNPGSNTWSLAGYGLTDDVGNPRKWVFPPGVTLAAGGFLVVRCDSSTPASLASGPVLNTGFNLDSSGDGVFLYDPSASLSDSVVFGPQAADFSLGRVPDGAGGWNLTLPTAGSANVAAATGDAGNIRINEWAASVANGPDWFELYNPNPQPVALGGLYLTDKLSSRTKHLIAPLTFIGVSTNAYLKFVADGNTAQGPNHVNFSLDVQGEAIGLFPPGTAPAIDSLTFGQQTTDVSEGRLPDGAANRVFFPVPTPGEANWLPLTNVFINEVLMHTDLPLEDAVELYNASGVAVDLSGWGLSDSRRDLRKFRVPDGTVIPAFGYQTFYEYQFNPSPGRSGSFSFNSAKGDEAWVTAFDTNGVPTGYRAHAEFGPQFNGVSFGRFLTSIGPEFTALNSLTLGTAVTAHSPTNQIGLFRTGSGAPNAYPRVGPVVISEIMFYPPLLGTNDNLRDEFIELHNLSGVAVPLYDPAHPTNGWRLRDGVSFDFTTNHVIPAGGYMLLVGFDPATNGAALASFHSLYGTNGLLVGLWSGQLANSGESLELLAPDLPQTSGPDLGLVPYVTMERIVYSNLPPWPNNASGTGLSLQRLSFTAYGNEPTNWLAATPTAGGSGLIDTDGDGMPDAWEDAHNLDKLVNDAGLDPDHDGFTNLQEYLAGTDPHDGASFLRFENVGATAGGSEIRFVAVAGRTYSVQYRDALGSGEWQKLLDVPAPATTQVIAITNSTGLEHSARFYRLVTPQMP